MFYQSPKLFTDPKQDYSFNSDLHFTDYINQSKKIIEKTRQDLTKETADTIIEANAPYELKPTGDTRPKYGALLIHGLFDSPFHLRDIGNELQKQGLLVRSILLPGHGTVPGALLNVTFEQWLQAVRFGIQSLRKEVDQIFLVGDSTGSSLALHEAKNESIAGLVLFSPALKIRSALAPFSNCYRYFTPFSKKASWFHISEHANNYAKYTSFPFNAPYQVYRLSQALKTQPPVSLPIFIALSRDDRTICAESILQFFQQHQHPKSQLILYSNLASTFNDTRITMKPSAYPDMHIINFSHICIPTDPNNVYYGMNGSYEYASHVYETNNTVYGEFNNTDLKIKKLYYRLGLTKFHYERLTFNPDFEWMKHSMSQFIHSL